MPGFTFLEGRSGRLLSMDGVIDERAASAGFSEPFVSNALVSNTRAIALAKAKLRGGSDIFIGTLGTSTSMGRGAGGGSFGITASRSKSTAAFMATVLSGMGLPAVQDAIISTNNNGASGALAGTDRYLEYNPTVTIGSTVWAADANNTVGGPLFLNASAGDVGALTLTPLNAFNTVDILYSRASGGPTMTLDIAGGTVTDVVAANATSILQMDTITTGTAAAVQATNVKRKVGGSTGNFRMIGLIPRDSAKPRANFLTLGWSGGSTSEFVATTNPFSPLNGLAFLAASARLDLLFIKVGENDVFNGGSGTPIPVASYKANVALLITTAQLGGAGVILEFMAPQDISRDPTGAYVSYNQAISELSATYGCPVIDNYNLYGGSFAAANASGLMFDSVHSRAKGYALEADTAAKILVYA